ncbi:MAG: lysine 2,3-aminomutase [Desulfuromonas sp.]|nr:MAG: lysine 2,3-aminomutase [Desulfuromonas sp.]
MEPWQQQLKTSLTEPLSLASRLNLDVGDVRAVAEKYPVQLTPYLLELLADRTHPFWKQFVPDPAELADDVASEDPLAEQEKSPVPAVVHRYPGRVLLLAANSCAAYCRFCTRKRRVGNRDQSLSFGQVLDGIDYVADHPEVNEVILSGGDPLTMNDGLLRELLDRLRRIQHVEIIRIATRMPAVLPERVTESFAAMLRTFQPIYLTTHFNHPAELTPAAVEACRRLADAGIPLANQTVLLQGVNDDIESLSQLCLQLLKIRVRPYYLHQLDSVRGTGHFRVSLARGVDLIGQLRQQVSGLAMPHYIVDSPGGHGKVELLPENVLARGDRQWVLRAPDGTSVTVQSEGD